jgi:hypothetical protein
MSFYKEVMKANVWLDEQIKNNVINDRTPIKIKKLVLQCTANYPVSEQTVYKRVEYWMSVISGLKIEPVDDVLYYEFEEKTAKPFFPEVPKIPTEVPQKTIINDYQG